MIYFSTIQPSVCVLQSLSNFINANYGQANTSLVTTLLEVLVEQFIKILHCFSFSGCDCLNISLANHKMLRYMKVNNSSADWNHIRFSNFFIDEIRGEWTFLQSWWSPLNVLRASNIFTSSFSWSHEFN